MTADQVHFGTGRGLSMPQRQGKALDTGRSYSHARALRPSTPGRPAHPETACPG